MKQFLKFTLASIVGVSIITILFWVVVISIASADPEPMVISNNSVLKVKFYNTIEDRAPENPLANFNINGFDSTPMGLNLFLKAVKKAKNDPQIEGIYLDLNSLPAGIASIEEMRNALIDFKDSGKFIASYSEIYSQGSYYLASVSDRIYVAPEGGMDFRGLSAQITFFKNALEKLGVEPQIIRHGKFKSAIEPFILDKMSPENREQTATYMGSIWNHMLEDIATSRNTSAAKLNQIAEQLLIQNAKDAKTYGLIDALMYKDEIMADLPTLGDYENFSDLNIVSIQDYLLTFDDQAIAKYRKDNIAVIYAQGEIQSGKGDELTIGSDRIAKAIRNAREDEKVKAIVLRVNSPGGSALASDIIWREVALASEKKTVIASMGNVAASGGYYISCAADKIFANPNTITGSIGVFGVLMNAQELLEDKIGLSFDQVNTNEFSDMGAINRSLTSTERAIIQKSVEDVYDTFITRVADGRKMTKDEVDAIGQGRVWSGENAMEIGLIDEFGGLNQAIAAAATMAELEDYVVVEYPEMEDPISAIFQQVKGESEISVIKEKLGNEYRYYLQLEAALQRRGIQARIPYELNIE